MNRITYLQAQDDSDSKAKEETGDVLRCEYYIHAALPRHGTVVRPSYGTWQESLLAILTIIPFPPRHVVLDVRLLA